MFKTLIILCLQFLGNCKQAKSLLAIPALAKVHHYNVEKKIDEKREENLDKIQINLEKI
jgi:hypothetical protein